MFSFIRSCQATFQSDYTIIAVTPLGNAMTSCCSVILYWHLMMSMFLIWAILIGLNWNDIVSICIFLMIWKVEYLLYVLLIMCISLAQWLLSSWPIFYQIVQFLLLTYKCFLCSLCTLFFIGYVFWKFILPVCCLSFLSPDSFFYS